MRILCNASIQLCAIHLVSNLKWNPKTSYHKYGQLSSLPFTAAHRKLEKRVYNLSASAAHPSIFTTCASITCARMSGQDNCHCSRVALGKYIHTPCGGGGGRGCWVDLGHFIIMTSAKRVNKHATTYTDRQSGAPLAFFLLQRFQILHIT